MNEVAEVSTRRRTSRTIRSTHEPSGNPSTSASGDAWFVSPDEVDVVPLPGGQWISLKHELSAGDDAHVALAYARRVRIEDGESIFEPDLEAQRFARLQVWIIDWSLVHPATGRKAPVTVDSLRALRGPKLDLIEAAIETHAAAAGVAAENPTTASASAST